jgi:hypothetical protein
MLFSSTWLPRQYTTDQVRNKRRKSVVYYERWWGGGRDLDGHREATKTAHFVPQLWISLM